MEWIAIAVGLLLVGLVGAMSFAVGMLVALAPSQAPQERRGDGEG